MGLEIEENFKTFQTRMDFFYWAVVLNYRLIAPHNFWWVLAKGRKNTRGNDDSTKNAKLGKCKFILK